MSVACDTGANRRQGGVPAQPQETVSARALEVARMCVAAAAAADGLRSRLEQRELALRSMLPPSAWKVYLRLKADQDTCVLLTAGKAYEQGVRDGYRLAKMLAESGGPVISDQQRGPSENRHE